MWQNGLRQSKASRLVSRARPRSSRKNRGLPARFEHLEQRLALSTYYVSPTGSDSNAGTKTSPFATFQNAIKSLHPGDTLDAEPGTYAGLIAGWDTVPATSGDPYGYIQGTAGSPVTIQADPTAPAGSVVINSRDNKTRWGIDLEPGCNYVTISGITIKDTGGITDASDRGGGIKATGTNDTINQCDVASIVYGFGLFADNANNIVMSDNTITKVGSQGNGNYGHGIYISGSTSGAKLIGNLIYNNDLTGIHINGDASEGGLGLVTNALIENNVIYNNGQNAINADGIQSSLIENNLIYNYQSYGICLYRIDASAGSINNVIVNNTIDSGVSSTTDGAIRILDASTGNTILNNILLDGTSIAFRISSNSVQGTVSNHNVVPASAEIQSDDTGNLETFATWQASTSQDKNSFSATPAQLFVNPTGNGYSEISTSPSIGAGTATDAPSTDIVGNARPSSNGYDVGAYEFEQSSTSPPWITGETPQINATGAGVSTLVTATFNESMQGSTIVFVLSDNTGSVVPASVSYNSSTNTATLTPIAALAYNATYTAKVSQAENTSGIPISSPFTWSFHTDVAPPTVTSVSPTNGANNVPLTTTIIATFNEPIIPASIQFTLLAGGSSVGASVSYNSSSNSVTLFPSEILSFSTVYTATVSGAQDISGDPIAAPFSWTFTAKSSSTPPTVVSESPLSGEVVGAASDVVATFDEPMLPSSVSFTLKTSSGGAIAATVSYNASNNVATLIPTTPLAYSTSYTASVSSGQNSGGVAMSYPVSWSFTTPSLASGLIAAWEFNEGTGTTAHDVTGDGNNGTLGAAVAWSAGLVGPYALSFNGSGNSNVQVPDAPDLEFSATQSYSLSAWVYVPSFTGNWTAIIEKSRDTSNWYALYINPSNQWVASGGSGGSTDVVGPTVNIGWSQVAVVQNGSTGTRVLYVNGVAVATGSAEPSNGTGAFCMGSDTGINQNFTGALDDVRLYNVPLSGSQVQSLASAATPTVVGIWPTNGSNIVAVSTPITATFNVPVQASSINFKLANSSGGAVAASVAYNPATQTATLTPNSVLTLDTVYTVTVTGAQNTAGIAMSIPFTWSFATDIPGPSVESESPSNGTNGASVTTIVSATFNVAVQSSTVNSNDFVLKTSGGSSVAATVSYNSSTNTATLTPTSALANSTTYSATVSGVTDTAGDPMSSPFTWSFTTVAPTPSVISETPVSGATAVSTNSTVAATFNEALLASTVNSTDFVLKSSSGSTIAATVSYNTTTFTATLAPASLLANSTTYTATLSGIENSSGAAMASPFSWSFTTGPAPAVTTETPAANAANVAIGTALTATFNEFVQASTVNATDFVLKTSSGSSVAATVSYNSSTNTATLTPTSALANSTTYTATISGVTDTVGDPMYSPFSWSFTTVAPAPAVTSETPSSSATSVATNSTVAATFSEALLASTVNSTDFVLKSSSGSTIAATVSYNSSTFTSTLTPTSLLVNATTYTATLNGISSSTGVAMASAFSWSFTTGPRLPSQPKRPQRTPRTSQSEPHSQLPLTSQYKHRRSTQPTTYLKPQADRPSLPRLLTIRQPTPRL